MKKIIALILVFIMAFALVSCSDFVTTGADDKNGQAGGQANGGNADDTGNAADNIGTDPITVVMEVRDFGAMTLELYPDIAPITVENFVNYVNDGFYNGLTFHRIYKGFMIQGGDPDGTGSGGQDLTPIKGEFAANGVENDLSHTRGTISMARTNDMNSATSQFFICDADSTFLDGQYAAFGKLIDGYDVLDSIADVEVTMNIWGNEITVPVEPVIIERVYVQE